MNTTEFIYIATAICPDRPFIVFEGKQWSFVQFNERVNRLANAFRELGLQKGDRVGIRVNEDGSKERIFRSSGDTVDI